MTDDQENYLSMFRTVYSVCEQNLVTVASLPLLNTSYTAFTTKLTLLNDIAKAQGLQITGHAAKKFELKQELAKQGSIVGRAMRGYASSINDDVLRAEIDFTETDLLKMRDEDIQLTVQTIEARATTNLAVLADAGITAGVMADLNATLTKFQALLAVPTVVRNERAVATEELAEMITSALDILRYQMDDYVQIFRLTNTAFYKNYTRARQIIDLHGPRTVNEGTIRGVVKDSVSLLIIADAVIEVVDTAFMVSSDGLGEFYMNLAPGTCTLKVTKEDYTDFELPGVEVVKGEEVKVEILLEAMV